MEGAIMLLISKYLTPHWDECDWVGTFNGTEGHSHENEHEHWAYLCKFICHAGQNLPGL